LTSRSLPATEQKTQLTWRIDADVVEFFKHTGKRYQTKINAVLLAYVKAHNNTDERKANE
jgi:uncharacterized protein (DUF4415 family)